MTKNEIKQLEDLKVLYFKETERVISILKKLYGFKLYSEDNKYKISDSFSHYNDDVYFEPSIDDCWTEDNLVYMEYVNYFRGEYDRTVFYFDNELLTFTNDQLENLVNELKHASILRENEENRKAEEERLKKAKKDAENEYKLYLYLKDKYEKK